MKILHCISITICFSILATPQTAAMKRTQPQGLEIQGNEKRFHYLPPITLTCSDGKEVHDVSSSLLCYCAKFRSVIITSNQNSPRAITIPESYNITHSYMNCLIDCLNVIELCKQDVQLNNCFTNASLEKKFEHYISTEEHAYLELFKDGTLNLEELTAAVEKLEIDILRRCLKNLSH